MALRANSNKFWNLVLTDLLDKSAWIGIDDRLQEGQFTYASNGEPVTYTNWKNGNPDNADGDENCVKYGKGLDFTWNDVKCSEKNPVICESQPAGM